MVHCMLAESQDLVIPVIGYMSPLHCNSRGWTSNVNHLKKVESLDYSCEVPSHRTGLQPYLFPSKVNLTMHTPHGGFTGNTISEGKV